MPHFVTSAQGKAHVTSANAAHLTAGLLGNGCYVLPIGQKLACTMTDSNTLRVLFGVASVCGRQWEIEGDYEEVNIDNGVPGYNRTDLLVCRIETAPQETIELKVYKGEETTGTPVQPGYVQGDLNDGDTVCEMPICSVRVNGINPQAPVMLAEESIDIMALLQELRDYKSQMQTAKEINDKGIPGAKLADSCITSAKIADGAVGMADLAAKSVTRAKMADEMFPMVAITEVTKQYTVGANSTSSVFMGDVPEKAGYTNVGMCNFYSGNSLCFVSGISGRYMYIKNTSSNAITATAKLTFLYSRI